MVNRWIFNILELLTITKKYEGTHAVDNVSFKVQKGDIYGFLGPNGAGKTTTIRMIMGIIHPDSGSINIMGHNCNHTVGEIVGYLPEDRGLYQKQKLGEIIVYFGLLRGLEKKVAKTRAIDWLERFELGDQYDRQVEELSKGNQQKVQFILSLIHDPALIILDEPFTGLDPLNQLLLKEIIQEKSDSGTTILFSTHQMEQVERLCNNICLINKGRIIIEGDLDLIRANHQSNTVELSYAGELNEKMLESYFNKLNITNSKISGTLKGDSSSFLGWINEIVSVKSFQVKAPTLEEIFIEKVKSNE